ncbi:MAG: hypothetical protein CVU60_05760 [Deltaproteobacteria bacterium HGW-Deltaproteobacteria-18]|jgi:sialic acid synthase SpsE|nr:MAG: hypothetical protein CVU60_05760 [Deltaproteobacteria bacterium HGW-Deltaproteobacteria-18]
MNSFYVSPVKVGRRYVGDGMPIFIMADIGLTNGGNKETAFKLVDIVSRLGVDAVKMQMIGPDYLLGDKSVEYTYETFDGRSKTENMYSMFKKLEYSVQDWCDIKNYVESKGMEFICTSHYMEAVSILETANVSVHKICTWSSSHKRLIQAIGRTRKPIIIDTGVFTTAGMNEVLDWYLKAGGTGVIFLHDFHTNQYEDMNFRSIPFLKAQYGYPVGYTPQGRDFDLDFLSIGMGVNVLEKRITLDRSILENGHNKALDPSEFALWFERIKELERALGSYCLRPAYEDLVQSKKYFKSLYLKINVNSGDLLSDDMVAAMRPGSGISASLIDTVCGRRFNKSISAGSMISMDDFI